MCFLVSDTGSKLIMFYMNFAHTKKDSLGLKAKTQTINVTMCVCELLYNKLSCIQTLTRLRSCHFTDKLVFFQISAG